MEMLPWIGGAALGPSMLTAATFGLIDGCRLFQKRKEINQKEIAILKQEIFDGINEHDAAHDVNKEGGEINE
jgi:hypothetical protein